MVTPYKATIVITSYDDKLFSGLKQVSIANAYRNIGKHFMDVAIGAVSEKVQLNSGVGYGTGTISIATGNMSTNDTVTINSIVLTAKSSAPAGAQFLIGGNAYSTAKNLAVLINSLSTLNTVVRASAANGGSTSGVVTVTALLSGTGGNYTWSKSSTNTTLAPTSALAGGYNGPISASNVFTIAAGNLSANDTVTIGGATYTCVASGPTALQFVLGGSARITANNLAALINTNVATSTAFSAVATGTTTGIVTVTVITPGTIGNNVSVTKSATNGTWTNTTFFASGTDAIVQTFSKGIL